jgi:hypothetical protein
MTFLNLDGGVIYLHFNAKASGPRRTTEWFCLVATPYDSSSLRAAAKSMIEWIKLELKHARAVE